ncbi:MAG: CPBP family intramembrane metalloprotease [Treponema sp.]|nr:CPBP family intramembrane metalloprotease [Treponema sp.]
MGIYAEALILYILLFFSGSAALITGIGAQAAEFSARSELVKLLFFCIPALALIWHIIIKSWKIEYFLIKPGRKDLIAGVITLPCLLIIGFTVTAAAAIIGGSPAQVIKSPVTAVEWVICCFSCIFFAYLEESYFRFYLLSKREELHLSPLSALIFSSALFSICHIYEGPWGFLNAVISGTFLCFMFLRYNSLHGIAIAHALYNISMYVLNAVIN